MATVTVYTAARMKEIEDASVVDGEIVGNDLILKRFDESEINAGNVRGPQGIPGTPVPTGTIIMGGWASDPSGYLILNGALVIGGAITYPGLASCYPGWVSGSNLQLPNATGAAPVGGPTPGIVSGSMSKAISEENMPAHSHSTPAHTHTGPSHQHTINHAHSGSTGFSLAPHAHAIAPHAHAGSPNTGAFGYILRGSASGAGTDVLNAGTDVAIYYVENPPTSVGGTTATETANANHNHTVTIDTVSASSGFSGTGNTGPSAVGTSGTTGSGTPLDVTPKNITVQYAVKTG